MVASVTIRLIALIAAPAYMSRTAFWIGGGGVGAAGSGSAPPVGYGWYMTAPGCVRAWRAERLITVTWPAADRV
jgi:hypothetical protein